MQEDQFSKLIFNDYIYQDECPAHCSIDFRKHSQSITGDKTRRKLDFRVAKSETKVTPLMKQYFSLKAKYKDAILLFRVGDFYETFGEDAITASRVLGIVLTNRNNGGSDVELAGFPHHALDTYLPRLVRAGHRVAICDQLEKPSKDKKIVKRGVTELVTPGLATSDELLDHRTNNFLASVHFAGRDRTGMAFLDLSTGEFLVSEGNLAHAEKLLQSLQPTEVICSRSRKKDFEQAFGTNFYSYQLEEWVYTYDQGRERLIEHFAVNSLKGFGIEDLELAQVAAGAVLHYLSATENTNVKHINSISRILPDRYVWLDRFTIRNLELLHSTHETGIALVDVLDQTVSPMGARLLRKWVVLPLKTVSEIQSRLGVVDWMVTNRETAESLRALIRQAGDLERLISRVPLGKVNPREVRQLERSLSLIPQIREVLSASGQPALEQMADRLNPCDKLRDTISARLVEDPPVNLTKGGVIGKGVSDELDELRHVITHSKDLLLDMQQTEAKNTGIANLKIGFNNVFGYYLEVTNKYKDQGLVPDSWVRKQTLTNAERYITDDLKKLESRILGAEEKILVLEAALFEELVLTVSEYIQPIQLNAGLLARLDVLAAFAWIAVKYHYCKPDVNESLALEIRDGRHPVIEQHLPIGEDYVPNDVVLHNEDQQILMITGPNMAGKSAILRQTALICLMAQMGSFVPAASARIGYLDKIFTRVGASDNISSGESTFMVEMNETAGIMNNISQRSLILLDEIGRGTSTYDGISIAWSIAEFLHNNGEAHPKTLFATHYHELNELANRFGRIRNFNVATREVGQKVIFLRKLEPGGSRHSFGIHVARLAGMPTGVVSRAMEILKQLEAKSIQSEDAESYPSIPSPENTGDQLRRMPTESLHLSIFETVDPTAGLIKESLLDLDINTMTPIDCMLKLTELRKMVEEEGG